MLAIVGSFWVLACYGGSSDEGPPPTIAAGRGGQGGQGGNGIVVGACTPESCTCENGLRGETECPSGECRCDLCPEFEPTEPEALEACGGEPFGLWRATGSTTNGFPLWLTSATGAESTCHGEVASISDPDFMVEFADGGFGSVFFGAGSAQVLYANSCVLSGASVDCDDINGFDCGVEDCGLCRCDFSSTTTESELYWTRSDNTLTLELDSGNVTWDYCVQDDVLEVLPTNGGIGYVLERVYPSGAPAPCAGRSVETCAQEDYDDIFGIGGYGCAVGACGGEAGCEGASSEATCTNQQGCTWDAQACSGEAPPRCSFFDFAHGVPGCELVSPPVICAGTAESCIQQIGCHAPGCLPSGVCTGGSHACYDFSDDIPGCTCDGFGNCTGTYVCEELDETKCELYSNACEWDANGCAGTPTACSSLDPADCPLTLGCALQAP